LRQFIGSVVPCTISQQDRRRKNVATLKQDLDIFIGKELQTLKISLLLYFADYLATHSFKQDLSHFRSKMFVFQAEPFKL